MLQYLIKLFVAASIIVAVTEVAKINATLGGLIKSLPLVSLIALIWVYAETHDTQVIEQLSLSTFWFVLPTLPMFLLLPFLLQRAVPFYPALGVSVLAMLACYGLMLLLIHRLGMQI